MIINLFLGEKDILNFITDSTTNTSGYISDNMKTSIKYSRFY